MIEATLFIMTVVKGIITYEVTGYDTVNICDAAARSASNQTAYLFTLPIKRGGLKGQVYIYCKGPPGKKTKVFAHSRKHGFSIIMID